MDDEYLDIDIIREIVIDAVKLCPDVQSVALVGSFARHEARHDSDVDLLLDIDSEKFSFALKTFGRYVDDILDNQFNKRLDIVSYKEAQKKSSAPPPETGEWYFRNGYQEMLRDAIWLYKKEKGAGPNER